MEVKRPPLYIVLAACILVLAWLGYAFFGNQFVAKMHLGDSLRVLSVQPDSAESYAAPHFQTLLLQFLILVTLMSILLILSYIFRNRLLIVLSSVFRAETRKELTLGIINLCVLIGCTWTCFHTLLVQGYQGDWYVIENLMNYEASAPFQQRFLFILFANAIKALLPTLSYIQAYCLSQLIVILPMFYLIRKWAEIFVPRSFSFVAQLILLAMIVPSISYYTFYDFGIVFFFTLCLYLLFKRKFRAYFIVFTIGIFNHEIILLMVFPFAFMFYDDEILKKRVWILILLHIVLFAIARVIQFSILPSSNMIQYGKFWMNLNFIFRKPLMLANTLISIFAWYIISFMGITHASKALKRCLILLPVLLIVILIVGQLNELRLFNCFIPVAIVLILCLLDHHLDRNSQRR